MVEPDEDVDDVGKEKHVWEPTLNVLLWHWGHMWNKNPWAVDKSLDKSVSQMHEGPYVHHCVKKSSSSSQMSRHGPFHTSSIPLFLCIRRGGLLPFDLGASCYGTEARGLSNAPVKDGAVRTVWWCAPSPPPTAAGHSPGAWESSSSGFIRHLRASSDLLHPPPRRAPTPSL